MSANDLGGSHHVGADSTGVAFEELAAIYALERVPQFGPKKFYSIHEENLACAAVIRQPELLPGKGKRVEQLKSAIAEKRDELLDKAREFAARQLDLAKKHDSQILTYAHPHYPRNVYESNNPIPILYVRGNAAVLCERKAVACVGSRSIRPPYSRLHEEFAGIACDAGFVIVSGFALGADTVGHTAAFENGGTTVCVMPGGLHTPFPPENRPLWNGLLNYSRAVFLTEFPFNARTSSLTLRKRNKMIVACAQGILVSQSAAKGGAMNAFRFALEQKKPVATFDYERESSSNPSDATSGNREIAHSSKTDSKVFSADKIDRQEALRWLSLL